MANPEDVICIQLLRWYRLKYTTHYHDLWHCPNGGYRAMKTAKLMKDLGTLPGVSDYVLDVECGPYRTLYLEIKTETGRPETSQILFAQRRRENGHMAIFAYGLDEAKEVVNQWMAGDWAGLEWRNHYEKKSERNRIIKARENNQG